MTDLIEEEKDWLEEFLEDSREYNNYAVASLIITGSYMSFSSWRKHKKLTK